MLLPIPEYRQCFLHLWVLGILVPTGCATRWRFCLNLMVCLRNSRFWSLKLIIGSYGLSGRMERRFNSIPQARRSTTPCGTCWLGLCLIESKKRERTCSVSWKGEVQWKCSNAWQSGHMLIFSWESSQIWLHHPPLPSILQVPITRILPIAISQECPDEHTPKIRSLASLAARSSRRSIVGIRPHLTGFPLMIERFLLRGVDEADSHKIACLP